MELIVALREGERERRRKRDRDREREREIHIYDVQTSFSDVYYAHWRKGSIIVLAVKIMQRAGSNLPY